jgi:hypothetical protein
MAEVEARSVDEWCPADLAREKLRGSPHLEGRHLGQRWGGLGRSTAVVTRDVAKRYARWTTQLARAQPPCATPVRNGAGKQATTAMSNVMKALSGVDETFADYASRHLRERAGTGRVDRASPSPRRLLPSPCRAVARSGRAADVMTGMTDRLRLVRCSRLRSPPSPQRA